MPSAVRTRWSAIVVLAGILSLDTADRSTLSTVELQLEHQLGIGPATFGLLAAVTPLVGLVLILPIGILVDRVHRTRLLAVCATVWAAAELVAALAPSAAALFVARAALGVVLAATPAVASLIGDFFPSGRRARDYGYVLSGELLGTGVGFVVTGAVGAALSWRWGFAALALLGLVVAVGAWRLGEPDRGDPRTAGPVPAGPAGVGGTGDDESLQERIRRAGIAPDPRALLTRDPADMPLGAVLAYIVRVRTNRILIVVSALSYVFLAGVQTFAIRFGSDQFGLAGSATTVVLVGLGAFAIAGVLVTGRLADRLVTRGRLDARVLVAGLTLLVGLISFLPGALVTNLWVAAPLLLVGAAALGGANPPLDAARLDVLHHHAWGRAESVRSALRLVGYSVAPVIVGTLVGRIGTGPAFAVLSASLALGGGIMLLALRSYAPDVAAADASPVSPGPAAPESPESPESPTTGGSTRRGRRGEGS